MYCLPDVQTLMGLSHEMDGLMLTCMDRSARFIICHNALLIEKQYLFLAISANQGWLNNINGVWLYVNFPSNFLLFHTQSILVSTVCEILSERGS
jgi:hypothetical protein